MKRLLKLIACISSFMFASCSKEIVYPEDFDTSYSVVKEKEGDMIHWHEIAEEMAAGSSGLFYFAVTSKIDGSDLLSKDNPNYIYDDMDFIDPAFDTLLAAYYKGEYIPDMSIDEFIAWKFRPDTYFSYIFGRNVICIHYFSSSNPYIFIWPDGTEDKFERVCVYNEDFTKWGEMYLLNGQKIDYTGLITFYK